MIGVVAVSHSARLGEAALELALQMVQGGGVRVQVAAGAGTDADGEPILGTDAVAVAAAIDDLAADCDGVLVLMDLGSAVLSAELALELRVSDVPVRLAPAPFVEGLLAAVVSAAAGGSLDDVAEEASGALGAKTGQLAETPAPRSLSEGASATESKRGDDSGTGRFDSLRSLNDQESSSRSLSEGAPATESKRGDDFEAGRFDSLRSLNDHEGSPRSDSLNDQESSPSPRSLSEGAPATESKRGDDSATPSPATTRRTVRVRNPLGIHARPAALIAEASAGASVRLRRLPEGPEAAAASLSRLLMLNARQGDEVELSATGDSADAALNRLAALFDDGFGEGTDPAAPGSGSTPDAASTTSPGPAAPAPSAAPAASAPSAPVAPVAPTAPPAAGTVLRGRGVSAGRAVAPVVHLAPPVPEPDAGVVIPPEARAAEVSAIEWAAVAVADQLRSRSVEASGEARAILDASRLLASDPELVSEATALVQAQGRSAARAVWETATAHEKGLAALGGRMAERVADIRDVRDRIIAEILQVDMPGVPEREEPFVLVAIDLAPADTAALAGGRCVALVTEQGGPTSHTAIIARSLGLPAVVGAAGATAIPVGATILVDGDRGTVEVEPEQSRVDEARVAAVVVDFHGAAALRDGTPVPLLANVGGAADARAAAAANAEGVGLFRTEFCFLEREEAPTVEEQVAAYRSVLAAFPGRKVVVRTLDAGSDKPLPFANADNEENPALGVRGLRVARRSPELLADQLRALALAAAEEQALVEVMAPMVSTVEEARDFAAAARAAGLERVGVMIETPAAALLASEMLEVVDFVSLGTNDLAQYTLAADRMLSDLGDLNDPWQPAVLRLIGAVGAAGRASGRAVGVCGEAGGDPALAPVLVGLGVTTLSMAPRSLGRVAAALADVTAEQCRHAAEAVLGAATVAEARAAASAVLSDAIADRRS